MSADDASIPAIALLAGGLAERLRPLTEKTPKSLIAIAGEPFIAHQLRLVRAQGVHQVVICAGYLWEQLRDFVADGSAFGLNVVYSLDGDKKLGTGGALKKALPLLGGEFLVMYGDSYLPTPFQPVIRHFRQSGKEALMTVFRNQGKWDTSNVVFEGGEIRVYDKQKKTPDMSFIDYGLGLFRAESFAPYPENATLDLADVYQDVLTRGQLAGFEVKERFYEIGSRQGIAETNALFSKRTGT